MWQRGQTIVHHEVWRNRVWAARPLIVVEDRADRLLLWIPQGTVRKIPATPSARIDPSSRPDRVIANLDRGDWVLGDHVWDVSSLWILHPNDWHAVWVSWSEPEVQLGWYVNLQQPFRRTSAGIESMDLMLDIVADTDLSWRWKDEDEFDEIAKRGIFDADIVRRVRDEARLVADRLEQKTSPFCDSWPTWRPDSTWVTPQLPTDWDVLPHYT